MRNSAGDGWHGEAGPLPITRYLGLEVSDIHAAAIPGDGRVGFPAVEDHNAPDAVGVGRMPFSAAAGRRVTTADAFLPRRLPAEFDSPCRHARRERRDHG